MVRRLAWLTVGAFALLLPLALLRMNAWPVVDAPITAAFNQFARRSETLDTLARRGMELYSMKGLAALALVYAAFVDARTVSARRMLVAAAVGACISGLASRAAQIVLPRLPRPLVDPAMHFTAPYGMEDDGIGHWNSFPSDTAALLFGLAAAILIVNRRWGLVALAIAVLAGLLRIYCGRHYPTDILAGAALGAGFALGFATLAAKWQASARVTELFMRWRGALAALAFFFAGHAAMQFNEPRAIATQIVQLFAHL
ncbi:MAG: phosphatase PAP2 family protein [Pseudomonadota bacterium]